MASVKNQLQGDIFHSKLAYRILKELYTQEGSYKTQIAENIGSSPKSVDNYIRKLQKEDLVYKKGKDGRKVIYSAKIESLLEIWEKIWKNQLEDKIMSVQAENISYWDDIDKVHEEMNSKAPLFVKYYISTYFEEVQDSNIDQMLYEGFIDTFKPEIGVKEELPDWLDLFLFRIRNTDVEWKTTNVKDEIELKESQNKKELDFKFKDLPKLEKFTQD